MNVLVIWDDMVMSCWAVAIGVTVRTPGTALILFSGSRVDNYPAEGGGSQRRTVQITWPIHMMNSHTPVEKGPHTFVLCGLFSAVLLQQSERLAVAVVAASDLN